MNIYQKFKIKANADYNWILENKIIAEIGASPISPWYHVDIEESKYINEKFEKFEHTDLVLFARRSDCDDMAFVKISNSQITGVFVVEGWIEGGYVVLDTYVTLWDWLKSVIDDIKELVEANS